MLASGETERRALPHLVYHMRHRDIVVEEVRIPPNNRALNAKVLEKLIKAVWFERINTPSSPNKFVVLVDTDGKEPQEVVRILREALEKRLRNLNVEILFAYAQEHLEAWYFADGHNLRIHVQRPLGKVDSTNPDNIRNPKNHLRNLLGNRVYTARVSEEIAARLDPSTIANNSTSFEVFWKHSLTERQSRIALNWS